MQKPPLLQPPEGAGQSVGAVHACEHTLSCPNVLHTQDVQSAFELQVSRNAMVPVATQTPASAVGAGSTGSSPQAATRPMARKINTNDLCPTGRAYARSRHDFNGDTSDSIRGATGGGER